MANSEITGLVLVQHCDTELPLLHRCFTESFSDHSSNTHGRPGVQQQLCGFYMSQTGILVIDFIIKICEADAHD